MCGKSRRLDGGVAVSGLIMLPGLGDGLTGDDAKATFGGSLKYKIVRGVLMLGPRGDLFLF